MIIINIKQNYVVNFLKKIFALMDIDVNIYINFNIIKKYFKNILLIKILIVQYLIIN